MNKWSKKSAVKLASCHNDLQVLANVVLQVHDCSVLCGHRTEEAQNMAYYSGKSKVKWPNSKHNTYPSMAIDLAPYQKGKDLFNRERVLHFAGIVLGVADRLYLEGKMKHRIRWGGDWDMDNDFQEHSFFDGVHFELIE